jgi:hypothetical protein
MRLPEARPRQLSQCATDEVKVLLDGSGDDEPKAQGLGLSLPRCLPLRRP